MYKLFSKYKEIVLYLVFGVATTVVNFIVYFICQGLLTNSYQISIVIAWIISVMFAFYTNKYLVFKHKERQSTIKKMCQFYSTRLLTLGMELVLMTLLIEKLAWSDVISKILVQVLIIVLNYFFSKLFIFKPPTKETSK